ncbi:MAG: hypothetical protein VX446_08320, partial [Bacteroidota bacterium]|nr:hypothetical protein [Bacteroidota bacterium]
HANWQTDTARARGNEIAAPRNATITLTTGVTEAAPALSMRAAEAMLPPGPSQASQAMSSAAAAFEFKRAAPMPLYESETDYASECN